MPDLRPASSPAVSGQGTDGTPPAVTAATGERNGFLDVVRAVAVVRVFFWHAFGAPWLSYVVASIPAMFFVTGALLDGSLGRRPAPRVIADRLRRLLLPLWTFAALAVAAIALGSATSGQTDLTAVGRLRWFIPVLDPPAAAWEAGWLSTPLWYLRAFLWLLLAAPALRWLFNRLGAWSLLVPGSGVVLLEWVAVHPAWPLASPDGWGWPLADLCLYGTFLLAGFAYRRRALVDSRSTILGRTVLTAFAAAAAAGWCMWRTPPDGVANNSHLALLLVGAAWLGLALTFEVPLARLATSPRVGVLVRAISRRSLTIYLWHTSGLALTYLALDRLGVGLPRFATAPVVVVGGGVTTLLAVVLFGWVEDRANRRPATVWPARRAASGSRRVPRRVLGTAALGVAVVAVAIAPSGGRSPLALALAATPEAASAGRATEVDAAISARTAAPVTDTTGRVIRPPTPSQRPRPHGWTATGTGGPTSPAAGVVAPSASGPTGEAAGERANTGGYGSAGGGEDGQLARTTADVVRAATGNAALDAQLQVALDRWRAEWGVAGVVAGVERPGVLRWVGASGIDNRDGTPMPTNDQFPTYSVTKSFVGTLVMQLVDEGRLELDDPLPTIAAVPDLPVEWLTVRMLLQHTSGLADYHDLPIVTERPVDAPLPTDAEVVAAAVEAGLGAAVASYSGTNYLVLGLLVEQVTGRTLGAVLQQRLFGPLDLRRTVLGAPEPGSIGSGAGGVRSSIDDLLRWVDELLRRRRVVTSASLAEMEAVDPGSDFGLGLWGFCPCTVDDDGTHRYAAVGHVGAQEVFRYFPATDTTVVFHLTESIWDREGVESSLAALLADLVAPASDVETERAVEGHDGGLELVAPDDAAGADG